ncbi:TAXI family TRAP transporter solute-binding subunit [Zwartia sp.]|uniref:TAXI family TRAP transporter solute-binding subunit n=1 Tax=Zwartia sp. TaxID=2978004 RepID=UPI002716304A|nr:TAXI family TRAP transporter solute-binding subunit [Zwartia sp.]MDO9024243.1 TAXI family TRAP transporter solute-binding subunit [Zwartia sp.]
MKSTLHRLAFTALGMMLTGAALAQTNTSGLPSTLAWSAYDVGSGGYNQAVAIGNALKQKYGINLRVLPGKNDVSRTLPIREGQVQFSANGVGGSYMAQEGIYEFGAKNWGPQPVRALLLNNSDQILSVIAAKDAGIKTIADMKGKRVAWVIGAPSLNQNITAILAFANLTWNDVKKVEFGGFGAALDGLINNQADVAFTSSISGKAYQLAKSPRGANYPIIAHSDKEGWKRLQALAPFFFPFNGTEGADLSPTQPAESASYPYPVLMTYAKQDPKLVKDMTQAMLATFDEYKSAAPGNVGWALDRQKFGWVIPYHEGAVAVFKEKGVWTAEHESNNNMLIKRQTVLADTWKQVQSRKHADDQAFAKDWMESRAAALTKAGMDPVLKSW